MSESYIHRMKKRQILSPKRLEMQDISRDTCSQQEEKRLQHPMIEEEDDSMKDGNPNERDGNNLDSQRNGLVLAEITDIRSELRMVEQPAVQTGRTTKQQSSRKQQKRRCGQKRYKDPDHSQSTRENPQRNIHISNHRKHLASVFFWLQK